MLVLGRKKGERVFIGKDIHVVVLDIVGERVRLGFEAPPETTIHREEVARRINGEATAVQPGDRKPRPATGECQSFCI